MRSRTGIVLIFCGTLCLLSGVGLQFYVAHLSAANKQQVIQLLADRPGSYVNVAWEAPDSVGVSSILTGVVGVGMVIVGVIMSALPERQRM